MPSASCATLDAGTVSMALALTVDRWLTALTRAARTGLLPAERSWLHSKELSSRPDASELKLASKTVSAAEAVSQASATTYKRLWYEWVGG